MKIQNHRLIADDGTPVRYVETPNKERPSVYVTRAIEDATGIECRDTVLGYIQRGGNPSPFRMASRSNRGRPAYRSRALRQLVCVKG